MGFETDELKNVACYADGCKEINTNLHLSFPHVAIRRQILFTLNLSKSQLKILSFCTALSKTVLSVKLTYNF